MLFAMPSVRRQLGLKTRPARDADTRAGRLVVGDGYLHRVLYGAVDTMRESVAAAPPKQSPAIFRWFAGKAGAQKKPAGPPPAKPPQSPPQKPPPKTALSAAPPVSVADLKARGYVLRGCVSKSNSAGKIAGRRWNSADTYYTIRNKVISGDKINPARIEQGMGVWTRR
jgi:hypothetical protein